jgi:DNA-binding transcriptional LysR family regulator
VNQEPLIWVVGKDADLSLDDVLHLVLLPSPCHFRKIATAGLEKANRKSKTLFTGTSIANIQAAVQAGMGLSILPLKMF